VWQDPSYWYKLPVLLAELSNRISAHPPVDRGRIPPFPPRYDVSRALLLWMFFLQKTFEFLRWPTRTVAHEVSTVPSFFIGTLFLPARGVSVIILSSLRSLPHFPQSCRGPPSCFTCLPSPALLLLLPPVFRIPGEPNGPYLMPNAFVLRKPKDGSRLFNNRHASLVLLSQGRPLFDLHAPIPCLMVQLVFFFWFRSLFISGMTHPTLSFNVSPPLPPLDKALDFFWISPPSPLTTP